MKTSVVYFDDVCLLCSRSVRFISKNDPLGKFQFSSLSSDHFARTVKELEINTHEIPDSIVLLQDGKIFTRSGAALRIAARLRFPWQLLSILFLIPRFIRNPIYDFVAKKRYRWFGKSNTCFIPEKGTIL